MLHMLQMSPSLARYPCPPPTYFLVVLHIDDELGWFSKRLKPFNHAKIDLDAVTQAGHFPRRVYFCYLLLPFLFLCLCPFAEQMPCASLIINCHTTHTGPPVSIANLSCGNLPVSDSGLSNIRISFYKLIIST